jgi:hypothetical protein
LLLIPCLVGYYVELLAKTNFVEAQRRRLTAPSDSGSDAAALHCVPASSRADRAMWRLLLCYATLDVICVALMLCETVVQGMAPVTCEAA